MYGAGDSLLLVTFHAGAPSLSQPREVRSIQELAFSSFKHYTEQTQPDEPERADTLLLRQPAKMSIAADIVEELFFAHWVGQHGIAARLAGILSSRKTE